LNNTLIGPFFIDGNLNAAKYKDILKNEILPARWIVGDNFAHTSLPWFQQDGAEPHYSRGVRNFLDTEFFNQNFPIRIDWKKRRN